MEVLTRKTVITIVAVLFVFGLTNGELCSASTPREQTGTPSFTNKQSEYIPVRYGHYAEFQCCAEGADDIIWSKWDKPTQTWIIYTPSYTEDNRVIFTENRQTLLIKSIIYSDEGNYKCTPKKGDTFLGDMESRYSLSVIQCDMLARGPYPVAPLACNPSVTKLGASLTLPCTGYFGCSDGESDFRVVSWFVSRGKGDDDDWIDVSKYSKRYKQMTFSRDDVIVGANLTISEVTTDDINRKFMCLLASPQIVHGQTKIIVELVTDSKGNLQNVDTSSISVPVVFIVVAGVVMSFSLMVVFIAITLYRVKRATLTKRYKSKPCASRDNCKQWTYVKTGDSIANV